MKYCHLEPDNSPLSRIPLPDGGCLAHHSFLFLEASSNPPNIKNNVPRHSCLTVISGVGHQSQSKDLKWISSYLKKKSHFRAGEMAQWQDACCATMIPQFNSHSGDRELTTEISLLTSTRKPGPHLTLKVTYRPHTHIHNRNE